MKRVMIAIPCLRIGGSEMQTVSLVRALAGAGNSVSVCCYFEHDPRIVDALQDAGAEVHPLGMSRSQGLPRLFHVLFSYFRERRPDITHIQHLAPALVPILAARAAGAKAVCATVHQPGRTYGPEARILMKTAARVCDTIFCVSMAVERSWFGSAQIYTADQVARIRRHWTVYDALDLDRIDEMVTKSSSETLRYSLGLGRGPVLGCVGRLRWEKGQRTLITALGALLQGEPELKLVMVGDGPDKVVLEKHAQELGVSANIVWLGELEHEDVLRYYSLMDVVVVPSLFEGFGLTAAEAMAAGKAVVASRVDGLSEIVQHGDSGMLVPPGNPHALADAIRLLLGDEGRCEAMGRRAREKASQFDFESFRERVVAAHETLVGPRGTE